jgi:FMN-dependent NADH-azoreductase
MSAPNILRINSSARKDGSVSRELSELLADALAGETGNVVVRDLADRPVPQVDAAWVGANFTDPAERTDAQREILKGSDALVAELKAADQIVIGMPIYNFSIPASLKAWIDQIARARETFRYSEAGPEGLLKGKTAWIVAASGGVPLDSGVDFATPYLRQVLNFVGIADIRVIDGTRWDFREETDRDAIRALARSADVPAAQAAE